MSNKQKRIAIILILYAVIFGGFYLFKSKSDLNLENKLSLTQDANPPEDIVEEISDDIYVHISGEVHYPGLVKLSQGQRLFEAIEMAGGMTDNADVDQINLSIILNDEDKIYIPKIGEISIFLTSTKEALININTCTKEELMTLSGIGDKTAESIIEYRSKKKFEKIEDIMNVNGIGAQKFENIRDRITI